MSPLCHTYRLLGFIIGTARVFWYSHIIKEFASKCRKRIARVDMCEQHVCFMTKIICIYTQNDIDKLESFSKAQRYDETLARNVEILPPASGSNVI